MGKPTGKEEWAARSLVYEIQAGRRPSSSLSEQEKYLVQSWLVYYAPEDVRREYNIPSPDEFEREFKVPGAKAAPKKAPQAEAGIALPAPGLLPSFAKGLAGSATLGLAEKVVPGLKAIAPQTRAEKFAELAGTFGGYVLPISVVGKLGLPIKAVKILRGMRGGRAFAPQIEGALAEAALGGIVGTGEAIGHGERQPLEILKQGGTSALFWAPFGYGRGRQQLRGLSKWLERQYKGEVEKGFGAKQISKGGEAITQPLLRRLYRRVQTGAPELTTAERRAQAGSIPLTGPYAGQITDLANLRALLEQLATTKKIPFRTFPLGTMLPISVRGGRRGGEIPKILELATKTRAEVLAEAARGAKGAKRAPKGRVIVEPPVLETVAKAAERAPRTQVEALLQLLKKQAEGKPLTPEEQAIVKKSTRPPRHAPESASAGVPTPKVPPKATLEQKARWVTSLSDSALDKYYQDGKLGQLAKAIGASEKGSLEELKANIRARSREILEGDVTHIKAPAAIEEMVEIETQAVRPTPPPPSGKVASIGPAGAPTPEELYGAKVPPPPPEAGATPVAPKPRKLTPGQKALEKILAQEAPPTRQRGKPETPPPPPEAAAPAAKAIEGKAWPTWAQKYYVDFQKGQELYADVQVTTPKGTAHWYKLRITAMAPGKKTITVTMPNGQSKSFALPHGAVRPSGLMTAAERPAYATAGPGPTEHVAVKRFKIRDTKKPEIALSPEELKTIEDTASKIAEAVGGQARIVKEAKRIVVPQAKELKPEGVRIELTAGTYKTEEGKIVKGPSELTSGYLQKLFPKFDVTELAYGRQGRRVFWLDLTREPGVLQAVRQKLKYQEVTAPKGKGKTPLRSQMYSQLTVHGSKLRRGDIIGIRGKPGEYVIVAFKSPRGPAARERYGEFVGIVPLIREGRYGRIASTQPERYVHIGLIEPKGQQFKIKPPTEAPAPTPAPEKAPEIPKSENWTDL